MKKLITATALVAFALATTSAMAEDSSLKAATSKTPTQQQMETQSTDGAKAKMQTPAGTTGAAASTNMNAKSGDSTLPGKPADKVKDIQGK